MNFENYFSPLQYLYIGYYVYNVMSVDELAAKLNKNRATIYRYEKGDIENLPIDILEPLARVLDTTPQYLMGWDREQIYLEVEEEDVKRVKIWNDAFGTDAFTDEEFEKIVEYGKFLISLRQK